MSTISERETEQVRRANESGRPPVVFVHGLWLLAESWSDWAALFENQGFSAVAAEWPGDRDTVEAAIADPSSLAGRTVGEIVAHHEEVVRGLRSKPVIVGHSFGGMFTMMLAGRGLAAASVAIAPAPFRGVLPLPLSAIRSSFPVLRNPLNRRRAVRLSYEEFRYAFANAVSEDEARRLYDGHSVPGPGAPIFQAAVANLNPWTELKVDTTNAQRGPLLMITSDRDHTVPAAIVKAAYGKQSRNSAVTELAEMDGRGHGLTIDSGWRAVAERALAFARSNIEPTGVLAQ